MTQHDAMSSGDKKGGRRVSGSRDVMSEGVIKLRAALGETQQQFANRLNIAIATVARWETTRPPRGRALQTLSRIAHDAGLKDLATAFGTSYTDGAGDGSEDNELYRAALYTLVENRGRRWLITELRRLISDAKKGLELRHPEVFTTSMEPSSDAQIAYLQSLLEDLSKTAAGERRAKSIR